MRLPDSNSIHSWDAAAITSQVSVCKDHLLELLSLFLSDWDSAFSCWLRFRAYAHIDFPIISFYKEIKQTERNFDTNKARAREKEERERERDFTIMSDALILRKLEDAISPRVNANRALIYAYKILVLSSILCKVHLRNGSSIQEARWRNERRRSEAQKIC